jgi:hypothetical protein
MATINRKRKLPMDEDEDEGGRAAFSRAESSLSPGTLSVLLSSTTQVTLNRLCSKSTMIIRAISSDIPTAKHRFYSDIELVDSASRGCYLCSLLVSDIDSGDKALALVPPLVENVIAENISSEAQESLVARTRFYYDRGIEIEVLRGRSKIGRITLVFEANESKSFGFFCLLSFLPSIQVANMPYYFLSPEFTSSRR